MRLADREPLSLVTKNEYDHQHGQRLTVQELIRDWLKRDRPEEGQKQYIARLIRRSSGVIAYAADFQVAIGGITASQTPLMVPNPLEGCVKVAMLPLDEAGQPIEDGSEKRFVDMDGTIYPNRIRALPLPLLHADGGYFLDKDYLINDELRQLLAGTINPYQGLDPAVEEERLAHAP